MQLLFDPVTQYKSKQNLLHRQIFKNHCSLNIIKAKKARGLLNLVLDLIDQNNLFFINHNMADGKEKGKDVEQENQKFRITISCTKLASIEQVTNEIIRNAKEKGETIKVRGPVRMPNKNLRISCRRTPCGEGSKTWDSFEMRIYKRYIDLECTNEQVKAVTAIKLPSGVDVNVIVSK